MNQLLILPIVKNAPPLAPDASAMKLTAPSARLPCPCSSMIAVAVVCSPAPPAPTPTSVPNGACLVLASAPNAPTQTTHSCAQVVRLAIWLKIISAFQRALGDGRRVACVISAPTPVRPATPPITLSSATHVPKGIICTRDCVCWCASWGTMGIGRTKAASPVLPSALDVSRKSTRPQSTVLSVHLGICLSTNNA